MNSGDRSDRGSRFLVVTVPSLCQGQTPFDVADEGLVEHLEMLQKKQSVVSCGVRESPWGA